MGLFYVLYIYLTTINVAPGSILLDQNAELFPVTILELDNIAYWISFLIVETIRIWEVI